MHCVLQVCWSCRKYLDNIVENQPIAKYPQLRSEIHDLQQIIVRCVIKIHVWLPSHNIDHFWVKKNGRFFHNIETVHSWVIFFHQQHLSISQCDIIKVWYITVWYCHRVILSQCDIITEWYYHTPVRHVWSPRFMFASGISCTDQNLEIWSVSMFVASDVTKWQCCNI